MDSKAIREQLEITQKEFSIIFKIPLRTVQNWDYRHNMPKYVNFLISLIVEVGGNYVNEEINRIRNFKNL